MCTNCRKKHSNNPYERLYVCNKFLTIFNRLLVNWYPFQSKLKKLFLNDKSSILDFIKGNITPPFWNSLGGSTAVRSKFVSMKISTHLKIISEYTLSHISVESRDEWSDYLNEAKKSKIEVRKIEKRNIAKLKKELIIK